ncbi:MAG: purine-nucleoside phosphorylase [Clostridia bacterium]|nr:purine-nucleoside phosphorylase [Clostridia bacterium]
MYDQIQETVAYLRSKTTVEPQVGIILGTGLGNFISQIEVTQSIPYQEIPHFPVSTVKGHQGMLIFGTINKMPVVALKGRFHFYEGYSMQQVTFPVRVLKFLGIRHLFLSNASGGTNATYNVGDIMIIRDHINLTGHSPLIGANDERLGPRFPDMSEVYDKQLISMAQEIATSQKLNFHTGVYAAVTGPNYETPAEYHYIRTIGADAVGMSTVPEAIVARHMNLSCFALSVISDLGVEGKIEFISHDAVIDAAAYVEPKMTGLVLQMIARLNGRPE